MANRFLDATEYSKAFLILVKNELVAGRLITGMFRDEVTDENGLSINVKRPPRFVAKDGATLQEQDIITGSVNVEVDQYKNVHFSVTDLQAVESFNDLMRNETMMSAASEIAQVIDGDILEAMDLFYSSVGTPGTTIGSPVQFNEVHVRLMEMAVPNESLNAIVSFRDGAAIRGNLQATDIMGINRSALEKTRIPIISEIMLFASNNLRTVTSGTRLQNTGPAVMGANQTSNYIATKDTNTQTLTVDGLGADATVSRGEIFTIAGVNAVNPRNRQQLDYLQQFVVTADATANSSGEASLVISPPLYVAGTGTETEDQNANTAFQNVNAVPADNAAITFYNAPGARAQTRAAFHKRAISLVSARLEMPMTGEASYANDRDTGISIRYWRGSDISNGKHIHRFDCIYGVQNIQPALGSRVNGS